MVLMRRKDKRRDNDAENIIVASDSSIVANKGVRSLRGARTGRFAADMRVNVGGYGRADKTWGVDHPWHQTQSDLFASMSSRDRMEDGDAVREEQRSKQQLESAVGASRAALKKKKSKLKKMGLSAEEAAAAALAEVEKAKQDALEAAAREQERREQLAEARRQKKLAKRDEAIDREIAEMARTEEALDEALAKAQVESERAHSGSAATAAKDEDAEAVGGSKKRKRVNRNKKKKEKLAALAAGKAESDAEESAHEASDEEAPALDAKAAALKKAKKEKRDKEKKERKERKEALNASIEERAAAKQAELAAREAVAKEYEAAAGSEVTTKSGLVIRDARLGKGKLPDMGEMCTVKYKGRLGKEGLVFGKGMLTTTYGTGSVIAGWEEGMGTMRPGGLRYLTIPPELGYGDSAKGGKIPANSTLFFEVELVRLGKRKRETVGKDEMPLPKAFQRKKIKEKKHGGGGAWDESGGSVKGSKPSKKRRRKHSV